MKRFNADDQQTQFATQAYLNALQLFNNAVETGQSKYGQALDELIDDIRQGKSAVRFQVDFDDGGILSFQFYKLIDGESKLIFEAAPHRGIN